MAMVVTIGGVARRLMAGSLNIRRTSDGRSTMRCSVFAADGTDRVQHNDEVLVQDDGEAIFWGVVDVTDEVGAADTATMAEIVTRVDAVDFHAFTERVLVTDSLLPGTMKERLTALVAYVSAAPYSVVISPSQVDGPSLEAVNMNFRTLKVALDETAALSGGYVWSINNLRQLKMELPSLAVPTAPFSIGDEAGVAISDIRVTHRKDTYVNRAWLRCGANAKQAADRTESAVTPTGSTVGDYRVYASIYPSISFRSQPDTVLVNGVAKRIGAPGTLDGTDEWEWIWQWVTSGPIATMVPRLKHNDAEYGATPDGVTIAVTSNGYEHYNIVPNKFLATDLLGTWDGYMWFSGARVAAREPEPIPWAVYLNGTPAPIGRFGTINEETGQPWDWVTDRINLGYRVGAPALSVSDDLIIYTRGEFELTLRAPDPATEPTSEQTTFGLHEELFDAPDVTDPVEGQAVVDAILIKRLQRPRSVSYRTVNRSKPFIGPGMVQDVVVPMRNLNGGFFVTDVTTYMDKDNNIIRDVKAVDNFQYSGDWRDVYRKWAASGGTSGSASGTVVSGGGGGGGGVGTSNPLFFLGSSGVEFVQSSTPTWVAVGSNAAGAGSPYTIIIDTTARGTLTGVVTVRLRARSASVGVTARLQNVSDGVTAGTSVEVTSTTWVTVSFAVALTAGTKFYELQLLPDTADEDVAGVGWLELI